MFVARGRLVGLVLAASAILTGCGGGSAAPRSLPPLTATDTPSPSPAPLTTATSKHAELAAATAVVRQYFRLLNNTRADGTVAKFADIETQACPCRTLLETLRDVRKRGEYFYGHTRDVRLTTPRITSPIAVEVFVTYDATASGIRATGGAPITSVAPRRNAFERFVVQLSKGRWLIANISVIKRGST